MALTATELQKLRLSFSQTQALNRKELRRGFYGAFEAFLQDTSNLVPASFLQAQKQATKHATEMPVFVKQTKGNGTVRKCEGTGDGTTAMVPLTYQVIAEEFRVSDLMLRQNQLSEAEYTQHMLNERFKSAHERLDEICAAFLEANVSAVNGGNLPLFTRTGGVSSVANDDQAKLFAGIKNDMKRINMMGDVKLVAGTELAFLWDQMGNYGPNNQENQVRNLQGMTPYFTNEISNTAGYDYTAYAFTAGTVGIIPWINLLHRQGKNIGTDIWTTIADPYYPITWELKIKEKCADTTGDGVEGGEADSVTGYVLTAEFALPKVYSSDTDTFIYKYQVASAA